MSLRLAQASTALESIAHEAISFQGRDLTPQALAAAKGVVMDWMGVTCGGADGVVAASLVGSLTGSQGPCRILGSEASTIAPMAALINGTAAHTLELDDIYAPGTFHPGAPVIAAAFAIGEMERASGLAFIRAVITGYEVGNRIASDLGPAHYRAFHTTGTAGALGAAAASASLMGLDAVRFTHSLAISATLAAGLQQTFRSDAVAKPLHAGNAAQAGVVAALAARGGATGALDILDGDLGMGTVMAEGTSWVRTREPWGPQALVEMTTMKPYPCCGHTFAAIDAAGLLRRTVGPLESIDEIVVETYSVAIDTAGIARPMTSAEARFSIPFTVAVMLSFGQVDLDSFSDSSIADPEVMRLLNLVRLERSAEFSEAFPDRRGARLTIRLRNGKTQQISVPDRFGSPENPMSGELLERKFLGLLTRSRSQVDAEAVMQGLLSLQEVPDLRQMAM